MTEQEIIQIIEEIDPDGKISQSVSEELVASLKDVNKSSRTVDLSSDMVIAKLKEQMGDETDWRKRASIAAKLISLNLE